MMGLSLPERAERLGLSCRELVELSRSDRRITDPATLATDAAVERLRRWIEADRPDGDLAELCLMGEATIRAAVRAVVAELPAPVRHHAIEVCAFVGTGIDTCGWCSLSPPRLPDPPRERGRIVALSVADPGVIAHEIGHSWLTAPTPKTEPRKTAAEAEEHERQFLRGVAEIEAEDLYRRAQLRNERQADACARLWVGLEDFDTCGERRERYIAAELAAAQQES